MPKRLLARGPTLLCLSCLLFQHVQANIRCYRFTIRQADRQLDTKIDSNGRCALHGGLNTSAKTQQGLQRISDANIKHGWQTKGKLAAQRHVAMVRRRVMGELKQLERQLAAAGLMPEG